LADGESGKATLEAIAVEIENVRTAWHWAMTHCQEADITRALEQLYDLYQTRAWRQAQGASPAPDGGARDRPAQPVVSNRARSPSASPNHTEALKALVLALLAEG
jgi:hypothetical protein